MVEFALPSSIRSTEKSESRPSLQVDKMNQYPALPGRFGSTGSVAQSKIYPADSNSSGQSLATLLILDETGVAISKSAGAGTSSRLSPSGSGARGSIQSSASRSASITGIRS